MIPDTAETLEKMARRLNSKAVNLYLDKQAVIAAIREARNINTSSLEILWLESVLETHMPEDEPKPITTRTRGKGVLEKDVENFFFKNMFRLLPEAAYIQGARNKHPEITKHGHIPDGFVLLKKQVAPVEVKLERFTRKSLEQLEWYMRVFESSVGVAVAPLLACQLPNNITFVSIDIDQVEAGL